MNKTRTKTMKISDEMRRELEGLEGSSITNLGIEWTDEMDAVLLEFFPQKKRDDMLDWWKKHYGWGSRETLLRRYRKLTEEQ